MAEECVAGVIIRSIAFGHAFFSRLERPATLGRCSIVGGCQGNCIQKTMPATKQPDLRKRCAAVRRRVRLVLEESKRIRSDMDSLKSATERVFTATYGRAMTKEERRKFFDRIEK